MSQSNICRTVFGNALQVAMTCGSLHDVEEYATLNNWVPTVNKNGMTFISNEPIQPVLTADTNINIFSLASYVKNTDTSSLRARYLGIGNRGHKSITPADQASPAYFGEIPHKARHAGLYGQIPFVLRQIGNDIPVEKRALYRHRCWVMIGGVKHIAYFLRLLTDDVLTVEKKLVTVSNGVSTEVAFAPTVNDLTAPEQPSMVGDTVQATGDYMTAATSLQIHFPADEVQELLNVASILYNNDRQAIVSEFAICSGLDKNATISTNGTNRGGSPEPEAVGVQVMAFLSSINIMTYSANGYTVAMNIGVTQPLVASDV